MLVVCAVRLRGVGGCCSPGRSCADRPPKSQAFAALMAGVWKQMLILSVWLMFCFVASMEFLHGRNRGRARALERWSHFVAKFFLDEGSRQLSAMMKASKLQSTKEPKQTKTKRRRTPSVKDLFTKDFNCGLKTSHQTQGEFSRVP